MIRAKAKDHRSGPARHARSGEALRVVPLFPPVQPRLLIAPPVGPVTRQSRGLSRPLLVTALLSLAVHGGALAAFLGWNEGPSVEAGGAFVVEVVAFSPAGGAAGQGPAKAAPEAPPSTEVSRVPEPPQRAEAPARPQAQQSPELPAPQPSALPVTVPMEPVKTPPVAIPQEVQSAEAVMAEREVPAETPLEDQAEPPAETPQAVALPPVKPAAPAQPAAAPPESLQQASLPPVGAQRAPSGSEGSQSPPGGSLGGADASRPAAPAAGNAPPDYPLAARRRGQEGLVVVVVSLSAGGEAQRIVLSEASGVESLDRAALDAVRGWRFTPASENGQAVASELRLPIRFRLKQ